MKNMRQHDQSFTEEFSLVHKCLWETRVQLEEAIEQARETMLANFVNQQRAK